MKQNISKLFNRQKLINNRLYSQRFVQPNLISQTGIDHVSENLSLFRRTFDRTVCFMGPNCKDFLVKAPNNFQPDTLFICDISPELVQFQIEQVKQSGILNNRYSNLNIRSISSDDNPAMGSLYPVCCDEEMWPFSKDSIQLIISNLHLHYVNDISVAMARFLNSLEPDGALVGCMIGGETLQELRISYTLAENERYGGVSQHVLPFIQITELGNILSRLNYTIPSVFNYKEQIQFESVLHLMQYLQESGESEALLSTRQGSYRETIESMVAIYNQLFRSQQKIVSTFEYINFTGWKHHPSQQQPKQRGQISIQRRVG